MNKTFKEQYRQDQNLEVGLANYWGYAIEQQIIDNKQKNHIQNNSPVIANITLRKFGKQLVKTDKIKEIQDEIRGLQNQRKLARLNEEAIRNSQQGCNDKELEQQSQIIKMMDAKIKEYNYIVEHKHIIDKGSIESRKILKMESKTDAEQLLQTIHNQKILLSKADLTQQIIINKSIAQLYRQYKERMNNQKQSNTIIQLNHSKSLIGQVPKSSQSLRGEDEQELDDTKWPNLFRFFSNRVDIITPAPVVVEMPEKYKKCSLIEGQNRAKTVSKFKEQQYKNYLTTQRKYSKNIGNSDKNPFDKQIQSLKIKAQNQKQFQKDVHEPFVDKKDVDSFRQMQSKIRSNSEALDLWKGKIVDACNNSRLFMSRQSQNKNRSFSKHHQESEMQKRQSELQQIIAKDIRIINIDDGLKNNLYAKQLMAQSRDKQKETEKIFSDLLKKRNNKFTKLWGTRILVKYDSEKQAKAMLKGQAEGVRSGRQSRGSRQTKSQCRNYSSHGKTQKQIKGNQTARDGLVQSQMNWKEQQADEEHYWRMCKNQKINLLLKRR